MSEAKYTGLQKAIKRAGGVDEIAGLLGTTRRTITAWLRAEGVSSLAGRNYPENAVTKAVDAAGGATAVGRALGVTYQAVCEWMKQGYMPAERAKQMELEFGVPRLDLMSPRVRSAIGAGGEL
jgi:hypothetical protein